MKIKKLNLGCGLDYKKSNEKVEWVNLDFNKNVKADVYHDLNKKLPFKDNEFNYIIIDNVLEHVDNLFLVIDEMWRISKPNATIEVFTPHFTGIYAFKHPAHKQYFGIGSFDTYKQVSGLSKGFQGERYGKAIFKILHQKLLYFHHNAAEIPLLSQLPINFLFNFSRTYQLILEKFSPLKFDEIYFKLKVIKRENPKPKE